MIDLSGQTITHVDGDGQLAIHTDAGWIISIEGDMTYVAADGTTHQIAGDETGSADMLASAFTGNIISNTEVSDTGKLTTKISTDMQFVVPPDEDFEAWNVVGPAGQRTVCTPGGELAIWNSTSDSRNRSAVALHRRQR